MNDSRSTKVDPDADAFASDLSSGGNGVGATNFSPNGGEPKGKETPEERRERLMAEKAARKAAREAAKEAVANGESTPAAGESGGGATDSSEPKGKETPEERRERLMAEKAARKAAREAAKEAVANGESTPAAGESGGEATFSTSSAENKKEQASGKSAAKLTPKKPKKKEEPPPSSGSLLAPPEAVLTTLRNDGKRNWMYPVLSAGRFWNRRRFVAYAIIVVFFSLPLIRVNGKPAVLLDIIHGEFTFFGLTLLRTDLIIMMVAVMAFFVGIVYITALFGRVWCGWGCPQTVYMEFVFRPIERLIEGKAAQRKKRDEKGEFFDRAWRKVLKYFIFAIISLIMANGFVAYFVGWGELSKWVTHVPSEHSGFFILMLVTAALTFFDFTYFREQMCTIACPYARIQSVLQDRNSMIVSFDPARGEPRGRRSRKQRQEEEAGEDIGLGDCIDCKACVRTCPTGIDIRDGLQMECIGCTQCVDACEAIMISIDKPIGLIRYTSENNIDRQLIAEGRSPKYGKEEDIQPTAIIRPRTIFYTIILLVLVTTFVTLLVTRSPIEVTALRNNKKNLAPFALVDHHTVANQVILVLSNRTPEDLQYIITVDKPKEASIRYPENQAFVKAGKSGKVAAVVTAPRDLFKRGKLDIVFKITTVGHENDYSKLENFALLGPD